MPEAQRGAGGVFSSRNSRPPGSAGSTGLTVLFPGKPLGLSAGGKEPGRGRGGESVGPCVRGAAAGLPGCGGDGWTGRAAHQMMAPRPAPWNGRDAAPGHEARPRTLHGAAKENPERKALWREGVIPPGLFTWNSAFTPHLALIGMAGHRDKTAFLGSS